MEIAVVLHVPFEGPAMIADWAELRGHRIRLHRMFAHEPLPAPEGLDLLVSMGGPMGVSDGIPFLEQEMELMRSCLGMGKKILGVCLGAQLLARALGAPVTRNREKEIGWMPVRRAGTAPCFAVFPSAMHVLHWHGDTFALPAGSTLELSSEACENQAFFLERGAARAAGLQFHLEMTPAAVDGILENCANELVPGRFVHPAGRIQSESQVYAEPCGRVLFEFLDTFSK